MTLQFTNFQLHTARQALALLTQCTEQGLCICLSVPTRATARDLDRLLQQRVWWTNAGSAQLSAYVAAYHLRPCFSTHYYTKRATLKALHRPISTSGPSNLTRPHHCNKRIIRSYLPGDAIVHPHLTQSSLWPINDISISSAQYTDRETQRPWTSTSVVTGHIDTMHVMRPKNVVHYIDFTQKN